MKSDSVKPEEKNVKWFLAEEAPDTPRLVEALKKNAIDHTVFRYDRYQRNYEPIEGHVDVTDFPIVLHGSIRFNRLMSGRFHIPGAYGFNKEIRLDHFMTQMDRNLFMNADGFLVPFGMFEANPEHYMQMIDPGRKTGVFYRPLDQFKPWVGTIQTWFSPFDEITLHRKTFQIDPLSLTLIAKRKHILREFRFVIVDRKVITGSSYEWFDSTSEDSELFQKEHAIEPSTTWYDRAKEVAQRVAEQPHQPDIVYTCDVARLAGEPARYKVVELNSFSSAGLYDCDLDRVVKDVSAQAIRDFAQSEMDYFEAGLAT